MSPSQNNLNGGAFSVVALFLRTSTRVKGTLRRCRWRRVRIFARNLYSHRLNSDHPTLGIENVGVFVSHAINLFTKYFETAAFRN